MKDWKHLLSLSGSSSSSLTLSSIKYFWLCMLVTIILLIVNPLKFSTSGEAGNCIYVTSKKSTDSLPFLPVHSLPLPPAPYPPPLHWLFTFHLRLMFHRIMKTNNVLLCLVWTYSECSKNQAPWDVLKMDHVFNLSVVLNYKDVSFKQQQRKLSLFVWSHVQGT